MLGVYQPESAAPGSANGGLPSPAIDAPGSVGGRTVRCCAVCGDSPAKLHYGVLACFGCKGFFRRAVKEGRNKYICRYEKQCKVDKYERNTCRWCRFRKCLLVGMNPDSVRPDRNETISKQKPKLGRLNSAVKSVHASSHFRLTRQDSGRPPNPLDDQLQSEEDGFKPLTPAQQQLLASITRLDAKCSKECTNQSSESVRNFTLKSLINERLLSLDDQTRTHYEARDISLYALWRIVMAVDWVNGICGLAVEALDSSESITVEDKIAIVQSIFARLVVLRICSRRVLDEESSDDSDLSVLRTLEDDSMYNSVVEDIIRPFKKSGVTRTELLLLQTIISTDPAIKGIRPAASDLLLHFRNRAQDLLVAMLRKNPNKSPISVNAQFGNYLLLVPTIMTISDRISAFIRQKFPISSTQTLNEPAHVGIIETLAHPDTTDYLRFPELNKKIFAIEKQEPSPIEKTVNASATYNSWHTFASAFTGIQMPGTLAYNTATCAPNFSIVSALSPANSSCSSLYSAATNLFPAQPLPEPSPSSTSSGHSFLSPTSLCNTTMPPLTLTAPTPPPSAQLHASPQFMSFHAPTSSDASCAIDHHHRLLIATSVGGGADGQLFNQPNNNSNNSQHQQQHQQQQPQLYTQISAAAAVEDARNNLNVPSVATTSRIIPKLPLQLTKSIEEMLRPAGSNQDDANFWNKPLTIDWDDLKVSTPAFNQEVVAKFFPECATSTTSIFKT